MAPGYLASAQAGPVSIRGAVDLAVTPGAKQLSVREEGFGGGRDVNQCATTIFLILLPHFRSSCLGLYYSVIELNIMTANVEGAPYRHSGLNMKEAGASTVAKRVQNIPAQTAPRYLLQHGA